MPDIVRVRASSLGELFDCPARWSAKHIDGLWMPSSGPAHLGTSLHASTAAFDHGRIDGSGVTIDDAAGVFVDTLHDPGWEVDWGDARIRDAERIGLTLHTQYCTDVAPVYDYTGVEVQCEALDVDCGDIILRLTGTTDRVRRDPDNRLGITDLKSGKRAVGADGRAVTKGHGLQLAVYEVLAETAIGEPVEAPAQIAGLQTSSNARVGVGQIQAPRAALLGTAERPGALQAAARIIKSGEFYGNPRSQLCSEKYCPAFHVCHYREWSEL